MLHVTLYILHLKLKNSNEILHTYVSNIDALRGSGGDALVASRLLDRLKTQRGLGVKIIAWCFVVLFDTLLISILNSPSLSWTFAVVYMNDDGEIV